MKKNRDVGRQNENLRTVLRGEKKRMGKLILGCLEEERKSEKKEKKKRQHAGRFVLCENKRS